MQRLCKVKISDGWVAVVYPQMLSYVENPDIASTPQKSAQYCREFQTVKANQIAHILNPKALFFFQEDMMSYHYRLYYLPFPKLIIIAEQGRIPKRLAQLRGRTSICVACIFGSARKRPWQTKAKSSKYPIQKKEDDAPGKKTLIDQIVSAQPGLVPQMGGRLTHLRIMSATVFVDHFLIMSMFISYGI